MSWLCQTKPRRTRAQTAASRRNLYAARTEQARRRRRAAAPTVNPKFVVAVVCVVVLLALVVVTRGLAVISAALVLTSYLIWKRRHSQEEAARVAALIKARLERSQTIDGMLGLTPKGFEEFVAEIMIYLGYTELEVLGGAGDEGADIRAIDPGGLSVVVQCKQYGLDHKVGSPEAQLMLAAKVHYQAGRVILVTTSAFTAPAAAYARKNGLELVDGQQLAKCAHHALQTQAAATKPDMAGSGPLNWAKHHQTVK
ncbi:MAG: restriction endonuclease [Acidimicrobiales bacterium]